MNDKLSFMVHLRQLAMPVLYRTNLFFCGLVVLLTACAKTPTLVIPPENIPTVGTTPTPMPTAILTLATKEIGFYWLKTQSGDKKIDPNLWTSISSNKIQNYTFSYPIESATGKDGSNWYIGPFGIIWQKPDGSQVLFSNDTPDQYGFPNGNNFRLITIGPDGQVWVGGRDKILFRFDGKEWINEGENIPNAPGKPNWLCYNKQIVGIDFDQDGFTWILTSEMEIYRLANGQWINLPERIPDEFMPVAGGGACPQGMRVYSANNIVVKRSGCCESPNIGIQFDGKKWKVIDDPKDVKMMFQWNDHFYLVKKNGDSLDAVLAVREKDKPIQVVPFFSWLAPPYGTYITETKDSIIYVTNENVLENEFLVAKFDENIKTWKSFLFRNFVSSQRPQANETSNASSPQNIGEVQRSHADQLCAAHVDEEGYVWLQFNCFKYDSKGELLPLQDTLYRLSPDIFDDYQAQ